MTVGAGGVVEVDKVDLLPARLSVLTRVRVGRGEVGVQGRGQVVWRQLLSVRDWGVLGRRVACRMPPKSCVGVPMREVEQMQQRISTPRGTGERGGVGQVR
jgi:hypothetical protein